MAHRYYSHRTGTNPNQTGLPLDDIIGLFINVFTQLGEDGYFAEAFGFECTDGDVPGKIRNIELAILLAVRKKRLWPIPQYRNQYSEDDFFDLIEFLFQQVSKPIDGTYHNHNGCGMHWQTFNQAEGRSLFREKANEVLANYRNRFELSPLGEILLKPEEGFEPIFEADIPSRDANVVGRINSAVLQYRRHGSTIDDRRQAVRDLSDVLEYLRPQVKELLTAADENDLFNIANNFGIRHHNDRQKTGYDTALWLSWMFYLYLATLHVVVRKIDHESPK